MGGGWRDSGMGDVSMAAITFPFGTTGAILYATVVVILVIYVIRHGAVCHACKRRRALERTGATREAGWFWFRSVQDEWQCKYCGFLVWKDRGVWPPD